MSWSSVIDLLERYLPSGIVSEAKSKGPTNQSPIFLSLKGFSLSQIDPQSVYSITSRKLRTALKRSEPVAEDLQRTLQFLERSMETESPRVWMSYFVDGDTIVDFLVDEVRGEVLRSEHRKEGGAAVDHKS